MVKNYLSLSCIKIFLTTVQIVGYQLYTKKGVTWESVEPWERMMNRKYRIFQADVQVHAPKDRTLMNYRLSISFWKKSKKILSVKDGWPKLCEFLGLEKISNEFPHENKNASTKETVQAFWVDTKTDYDERVEREVIEWMNRNGYECKKVWSNKRNQILNFNATDAKNWPNVGSCHFSQVNYWQKHQLRSIAWKLTLNRSISS